jgi:hypothetical protein
MPGRGRDGKIMRFGLPESGQYCSHSPIYRPVVHAAGGTLAGMRRWLSGGGGFHAKIAVPPSEYTMNIFYIIGVIVVVLFIAGFFGLHA